MAEIKVFCLHCGQHIQCAESCRGTQLNCPSCHHSFLVPQANLPGTLPRPQALQQNNKREFYIRWRGRTSGPLDLSEIESRVDSGQIGMLTEIQVGTEWVNLKVFYKMAEARSRQTESAPKPEPFSVAQSSSGIMADHPADGGRQHKNYRLVIFAGVFLLLAIVATFLAMNLKQAKPLPQAQNRIAPQQNPPSNSVAISLPFLTNQMPHVSNLLTNQTESNGVGVFLPAASNISEVVPVMPALPPPPPLSRE